MQNRIVDLVHLAGSVASITGILLVIVQSASGVSWDVLVYDVPLYLLLAASSLGIVTLGIIAFRTGWQRFVRNRDILWKLVYSTLAGSALSLAVATVLNSISYGVRLLFRSSF